MILSRSASRGFSNGARDVSGPWDSGKISWSDSWQVPWLFTRGRGGIGPRYTVWSRSISGMPVILYLADWAAEASVDAVLRLAAVFGVGVWLTVAYAPWSSRGWAMERSSVDNLFVFILIPSVPSWRVTKAEGPAFRHRHRTVSAPRVHSAGCRAARRASPGCSSFSAAAVDCFADQRLRQVVAMTEERVIRVVRRPFPITDGFYYDRRSTIA